MLVLAGFVPDSPALRAVVIFGIVLGSVSLLYRIWHEIREATSEAGDRIPPPGSPG